MKRWYDQGFAFSKDTEELRYGLKQGNGGPCGILAVVFAEMLSIGLFEKEGEKVGAAASNGQGLKEELKESESESGANTTNDKNENNSKSLPEYDEEATEDMFVRALVCILRRASTNGFISVVTLGGCGYEESTSEQQQKEKREKREKGGGGGGGQGQGPGEEEELVLQYTGSTSTDRLFVYSCSSVTEEDCIALVHTLKPQFFSRSGCFLFLLSLLRSRGIKHTKDDMDVDDNTLIGQFGHCTQDLINLLITGMCPSLVQVYV